jgi:hypothetical protein
VVRSPKINPMDHGSNVPGSQFRGCAYVVGENSKKERGRGSSNSVKEEGNDIRKRRSKSAANSYLQLFPNML